MRRVLLFLVIAFAAPATAQDAPDQPIVRTQLDPAEVLTGQQTTLTVTVLVPSFFSEPVTLPSYDLPNIMVELPDEDTHPVSERVQGRKWSGVRRQYLVTPLVPGEITLPAQSVSFTYADADYQPVKATAPTDAVILTGLVPPGAEGLDPFLAANALTLNQVIAGAEGELEPGAAITRTVTATIDGSRAMTIPPLLPPLDLPGLSEHPDPPEVTDDPETGIGTRVESVTYIPKQGGRFTLPDISIGWYNIAADQVEQATASGVSLAVRGPSPAETSQHLNWRMIAVIAMALLLLAAILWALWRRYAPILRARAARARAAWQASPRYALRQARRAVQDHRLGAAIAWTSRWWRRGDREQDEAVQSAYLTIGRGRYGPQPFDTPALDETWDAGKRALDKQARQHPARQQIGRDKLPRLNP